MKQFKRFTPIIQSKKTIKIDLPAEFSKEIPAKQIKINKLEIFSVIDEPSNKKVTALLKHFGKITLWEGDAYDEIGQWTDDDVKERLIEIYSN
jgi:hypothetical protein